MHEVLVVNCNKYLILHFCELSHKKLLKKPFVLVEYNKYPTKNANFFKIKISEIWLSFLISTAKHLSFIFRPNLKNFVSMIIAKIFYLQTRKWEIL